MIGFTLGAGNLTLDSKLFYWSLLYSELLSPPSKSNQKKSRTLPSKPRSGNKCDPAGVNTAILFLIIFQTSTSWYSSPLPILSLGKKGFDQSIAAEHVVTFGYLCRNFSVFAREAAEW